MAKKISDLNDGTPAELTDKLEVERVSPNESANVTVGDVRGDLQETTELGNATPDGIQFTNLVNPPHAEGLVFYDNDKHALSYFNEVSNTTINIAQEIVIRVQNNDSVTISNGEAVRVEGASSGVPTVIRAIADSATNAIVSGVATDDITVGSIGYITRLGNVGGLNTVAFLEGDVLFLSDTTPGELVGVPPGIVTAVAIVVVVDAVDGMIVVGPQPVADPTAIAQASTDNPQFEMLITTTPTPLVGYSETSFAENMTVISTAVSTSFRAEITPLDSRFTGFYEFTGNLTLSGISANVIIVIELYINQVASTIISSIDASQASVDTGSTIVTAITEELIDETEELELYIYTTSGTADVTIANIIFNAKRLGII